MNFDIPPSSNEMAALTEVPDSDVEDEIHQADKKIEILQLERSALLAKLKNAALAVGLSIASLLTSIDPVLARQAAAEEFAKGSEQKTEMAVSQHETTKKFHSLAMLLVKTYDSIRKTAGYDDTAEKKELHGDQLQNSLAAQLLDMKMDKLAREQLNREEAYDLLVDAYNEYIQRIAVGCKSTFDPNVAEFMLENDIRIVPYFDEKPTEDGIRFTLEDVNDAMMPGGHNIIIAKSDAILMKVHNGALEMQDSYDGKISYVRFAPMTNGLNVEVISEAEFNTK